MKRKIPIKRLRSIVPKLFVGTTLASVAVYAAFYIQGQREQEFYHALLHQADIVNSLKVIDANLIGSIVNSSQINPNRSNPSVAKTYLNLSGNANRASSSATLSSAGQSWNVQSANYQSAPVAPPFGISYAPSSGHNGPFRGSSTRGRSGPAD